MNTSPTNLRLMDSKPTNSSLPSLSRPSLRQRSKRSPPDQKNSDSTRHLSHLRLMPQPRNSCVQEMRSSPQQYRRSRTDSPLLQPPMPNIPPVHPQTRLPHIPTPPQPLRRRLSFTMGLPRLQPRPRHHNASDPIPQRQPADPARKGLQPTTQPRTPSPSSTPCA